jgi:hypothetical protein
LVSVLCEEEEEGQGVPSKEVKQEGRRRCKEGGEGGARKEEKQEGRRRYREGGEEVRTAREKERGEVLLEQMVGGGVRRTEGALGGREMGVETVG